LYVEWHEKSNDRVCQPAARQEARGKEKAIGEPPKWPPMAQIQKA
jgi:hypothetical protein